ncbi:GGDEF domain-containing protein [Pseudomonas sp. FW300-N1A1]|uniref:GGDEF domain-containing protein n=1 Tax=Pseudomonas sp. FW300-N1A1 TaxID=2075555 RepID=UPI000CD2B2B6|nr:GGDEF domain-containing protein [Pseudomonas sp. FW300-N1A1]POA20279.1 GGDEF domain-containing protein [Pseudomonas sp. FW300-N1A1]
MNWVVEHARSVRIGCWLVVAVLSLVALQGLVHQYQLQRELLLAGQHAALVERTNQAFSSLMKQISIHELHQALQWADPPTGTCLSSESITRRELVSAILARNMPELDQQLLSVPRALADSLSAPDTPHMSLNEGKIRMVSRQVIGYACDGGFALIQQTQTEMTPVPLPARPDLARAFGDGIVIHVAMTQEHEPVLYFDIHMHLDSGRVEYLPCSVELWQALVPPGLASAATLVGAEGVAETTGGERFTRHLADPGGKLQLIYYSEPLISSYLALFVRINSFPLMLLAGLLVCLPLIGLLLVHLVDISVAHHQAATRDFLTGAYNRRALMVLGERELSRAIRNGRPLSVLQLDIDHFKRINDTYGHDGGDQVLKFFVRQLERIIRQHDVLARMGGEEFVILLPDTDLEGARLLAERLLKTLRKAPLSHEGQCIGVTCSLGVSAWRGTGDSLEALLIRADQLLYQAKQQGRDRYVCDIGQVPVTPTCA